MRRTSRIVRVAVPTLLVSLLASLLAALLGAPVSAAPGYAYCHRYDAYELGGCGSTHRLPASPVGGQLRWVLAQLAGDARSLTESEVAEHVDPSLLAVFPAPQVVAAFRGSLDEVGPARFRGFDYPAREHEAVALVDAPSLRGAVDVGVSPTSGLLTEIGLTEAPPTIVPRGRHSGWFDVGGRRLFLRCTGHRAPTVVFENGLTSDWYDLQDALSGSTRVCSYDPALQNGAFSRSDPAATPRTAADRVRDLHRLLNAADVRGPVVIAGHSNGGLFGLLYASRHPRQVAGLVLIDGVHPGYHAREVRMLRHHLPPATWREFAAHACDVPPAVIDPEQLDICASERQTRVALRRHPLRRLPLSVISHGVVAPGTYPDGWPSDAEEALWSRLQDELADLEPGSHHVVATRSDHDIQHEQPRLVLREIRAVVDAVRAGHTSLPHR
jgi:pimeloyl-ACP methyl ester carboxylesterase